MKTRALFAAAMLTAVFLPAATPPLGSTDVIGKITYLVGTLAIVRDEDTLDAKIVKTGLALENFDLLITGADGEVELQIESQAAPLTTVRVAPRTRFSLEVGKMGSKHQTTVGLMIGTVSVKCAKLSGSQSVKVQTDTTVMGVRGTNFTVTAAASGDLLVDCVEGEVECADEGGDTEQANPGEVVEKLYEERLRRLPVAVSSLEQFKRFWNIERISALKANAPRAIANFARRYRALLKQFGEDYTILLKAGTVIEKWKKEDRDGKRGSTIEMMQQKKAIVGALYRMHGTLRIFERVYARLLELKEYFAQGLGESPITYDDQTTETAQLFFQRLEQDRHELERKVGLFRRVVRMYMARNDGHFPWDD
jgi:hypothetical protein